MIAKHYKWVKSRVFPKIYCLKFIHFDGTGRAHESETVISIKHIGKEGPKETRVKVGLSMLVVLASAIGAMLMGMPNKMRSYKSTHPYNKPSFCVIYFLVFFVSHN